MKEENLILTKTYHLLRSRTSIGANAEEGVGGVSKKDFINKFRTAYKEARETKYWLRLLMDSEILEIKLAKSFIADCDEIFRILTSILNTSKGKK